MSVLKTGRVVLTNVLLLLFIQITCANVPEVTIQALKPKGFKASIPADPSISLFAFNGNINRPIDSSDVGTINIEVTSAKDGRWTAEDNRVELKVGDVINYYVFVAANKTGYLNDNLSFTVKALEDPSTTINPTPKPANCHPTVTRVRGGSACAGQTIFEDNFSSFRDDVWQIEQYIPVNSPEFPFVSYQRLFTNPTVSVADGNLRIKARLQKDQPGFTENDIYTGTLDLFSGCTAEACTKTGWGANILPPVISGRITSKGFTFTYGTVYIRAKLPQGDWLYPDILLEPFLKKYGAMHYSSGVIKIASARGNRELKNNYQTDYSNKVLFGGPIMNFDCHDLLLNRKQLPEGQQWGDDFHVYAIRWEPERITLLVDDVEYARVEPTAEGLQGKFPDHCKYLPRSVLAKGTKMAPFDDFFYITLGVSAGGVVDFPDWLGSVEKKPWENKSSKALLSFYGAKDIWYPTWTQPEMLVDYVKVVAL